MSTFLCSINDNIDNLYIFTFKYYYEIIKDDL